VLTVIIILADVVFEEIEAQLSSFIAELRAILAELLGVDPLDIIISAVTPGSINVDFTVVATDEEEALALQQEIEALPEQAQFTEQYGSVEVLEAAVVLPPHDSNFSLFGLTAPAFFGIIGAGAVLIIAITGVAICLCCTKQRTPVQRFPLTEALTQSQPTVHPISGATTDQHPMPNQRVKPRSGLGGDTLTV